MGDEILTTGKNFSTANDKPIDDKSEKTGVNNQYGEEFTEPEDLTDLMVSKEEVANANSALTLINGIFGYVNEYGRGGQATGNKIWLSLTPYEISPRLGDISLFRQSASTADDAVSFTDDFNKYSKDEKVQNNTRQAMTVGNRLQASRLVTNYMTEILTPKLDVRFGSKDHRVGQQSRFLNSETGDEADRSAFLHIVPDLENSNGRIAIPYAYEKKDKTTGERTIEKYMTAFVPVNFNFIHSKYTLTIKEFMLSSVGEQNREIYSLDKTFDGNVLRFFGSHPKIISLQGVLSNFDDDLIGMEKLFGQVLGLEGDDDKMQTVTWSGQGNQTARVSSRGSMRDTFLSYYNNFLKGTKAKDFGLKIYLYYNWRIIEGYLIELDVQTSGDNDNAAMFSANMVVKSESSVYEQGVGLGKSVPYNFYSRRFGGWNSSSNVKDGKTNQGVFELGDSFSSEKMLFRKQFREYAIGQALEAIKAGGQFKSSRENSSDVYMQFLEADDPYLKKNDSDVTSSNSEYGTKLNSYYNSSDNLKKLINLYVSRFFVMCLQYNRTVTLGKTAEQDGAKAYLEMESHESVWPWPDYETGSASWITNTTESKLNGPFFNWYEAYKDLKVKSILDSFITGFPSRIEGDVKVKFKLSKPSGINTSSSLYTDFVTNILTSIKSNWLSIGYSDTTESIADLTLNNLLGYVPEIKTEIDVTK